MRKRKAIFQNRQRTLCLAALAAAFLGCARNTGPDDAATVQGRVLKREDSTAIPAANVVLYDADANTPIGRMFTDAAGEFRFEVNPGNYHLSVSAQGRIPSPPKGGRPVAFLAAAGKTVNRQVALDRDSAAAGSGSLAGTVRVGGSPGPAGILVVALRSDSAAFSTSTGPGGVFILYNLPPGTYGLRAYRAGLVQDSAVSFPVRTDSATQGAELRMTAGAGKTLRGRLTFLASKNSRVDITLVHPLTREAIPGLSTYNDENNGFALAGIPPGDYIAWASYRNDGYVMDPDRIRKFGLPAISFAASDTAKTLDFEVTGAVEMRKPTNPPDTLYPAAVGSLTPVLAWSKYASAKEYVVEVFDAKGRRIWGGFDPSGSIRHASVPAAQDSVRYNFDGSASEALKPGEIYSWKVFADNDDAPGVQGLISSSEDLRGIFQPFAP